MALVKRSRPTVILGCDELDGLIKLLEASHRPLAEDGEVDALYYEGALAAVSIFRYHEYVDFPADFMRLFEHMLTIEDIERTTDNA